MYSFRYHGAGSVADASEVLQRNGDSKFLAGGQTLLASLKLRLAQPECVVDLGRIEQLRGISVTAGKSVTVGAMTTHATVSDSLELRGAIPALASLAGHIADPMVREMGTLGGSLANNDPSADYPAAVLALDATILTSERRIPAASFFLGLFQTALLPHELITAVEFPIPRRAAYVKFKHPASRFALVGVFVAETQAGPRVAVTGAGACVFRVESMEQALVKHFSPDSLAGIAVDASALNSDIHASAEYRAHLVSVLARRAVAAALA